MNDVLQWVVLVFVALVVGVYVGHYVRRMYGPVSSARLHHDYLVGLNFLLNEQPEKAVDIFIHMLKVDKDTIETHIALGNLFRRRGEVDRALRIHQQLVARDTLDTQQRVHALFELGQDYLSAGIVDRAEKFFKQVIQLDEEHVLSLRRLLDIYEQTNEWMSAIAIAQKYELATGKSMHTDIAQFYCEHALTLYQKKRLEECTAALDEALVFDKRCVRASLLKGRNAVAAGDMKSALKHFKHIKQQQPEFLSEAIKDIVACYDALNDHAGLVAYLQQIIKEHPELPVLVILADQLKAWRGEASAARFVSDYLRAHPSFSGVQWLLQLHLPKVVGPARQDMHVVLKLVERVLKEKPDYRCWHCGFASRLLHWQCLKCKRWGTMRPMRGIDIGK